MTPDRLKQDENGGFAGGLQHTTILGSRVHMVQIPEVLNIMETWIQHERIKCHQIIVTGMHGIIEGHKDPGFRHILNSADLFVPDGISVTWIGRRRGFPLKARACGADLMRAFFQLANHTGSWSPLAEILHRVKYLFTSRYY